MTFQELEIKEESLQSLDDYSRSCLPCQLLQSSKWLKFQKEAGHMPRLFSWQEENSQGYFMALEMNLIFGKKYFYIPRGPFLGSDILWPKFIEGFKNFLRSNKNLIFVRFEPDNSFSDIKLCRQVSDVQPKHTFYTDLKISEAEILEHMHPKTRYNIRLGLKKKLIFTSDDGNFEAFWELMKETSTRDKFISHSKSYYETMIKSGAAKLATVRHNNKLLAAGIFAEFGNTLMYLHGASASDHRELMAPYVLHWEMIKLAKTNGLEFYDWHGVDSKKWPGFTRFKYGFGGHDVNYPGTFDLILASTIYLGYNILRGVRRLF